MILQAPGRRVRGQRIARLPGYVVTAAVFAFLFWIVFGGCRACGGP